MSNQAQILTVDFSSQDILIQVRVDTLIQIKNSVSKFNSGF